MSSLVSLASGRKYSVEQVLEIIESLRESIASGETVAFAAVGITPEGTTFHWIGSARVTLPLTMLGAIAGLQHVYATEVHSDE